MNKLDRAMLYACLLFTAAANAGSSTIDEQSQGDVSFISGGIGSEERAALKKVRNDYNLSLLFAQQGSGKYVSDVAVRIADGKRHNVLDSISQGPIIFAKLKPGHYRVSAEHNGQIIRKNVTVDSKQRTPLSFSWPDQ
ncbi:MAG: hypothetical protein BVN35_18770 [Proteobacteria bacterium ST_bin11]|nr:MAG: hypothetical protein BVN35_18770 [Proteobacteria bacterium ST_bin11]